MSIARQETEIAILVGHEPEGTSATAVIARHADIEVFTMRSYCNHDGIVLLLVTTNADKTSHVLKVAGYHCQVNQVVLIGPLNRTGWALPLGIELAEVGIEVLHSYTSHRERDRHYLVFKTSDDDRAIQVLTTGPAFQLLASNDCPRDQEMAIAGGSSPFQPERSAFSN
jgi:hypothetical protein